MTTHLPPQVSDEDWFARFKRELELRGASGQEIGEAAASVDEYCRDARVRAPEAFGDPVGYAARLRGTGIRLGRVAGILFAVVAGMWGALLSLWIPLHPASVATLSARPVLLQVFMLLASCVGLLLWPRAAQLGRALIFFVLFASAQMAANLLGGQLPADWGLTLRGWQWCLAVLMLVATGTWGIRASIANRVVDPRVPTSPELKPWRALAPWLLPLAVLGMLCVRLLMP